MKHGFIKVAVATPKILVADPTYNAGELIRLAQNAAEEGVRVLVFPELTLTGYTAGDLFLSDTLLTAAKQALAVYLQATAQLEMLSVVGLPLEWNGKLYNCAAVCCKGAILGVVPKTHIPSHGEYSEGRYFHAPINTDFIETVTVDGKDVFFGTRQLFTCREVPALRIAVEIEISSPSHHKGFVHADIDCFRGKTLRQRLKTPVNKGINVFVVDE